MKLKNIKIGTLRLPAEFETAILLIKEDLKNTRLMNSLNELGFDETYHRPHWSLPTPASKIAPMSYLNFITN